MTVTFTALLKIHVTPCSIICLSQKYTPESICLTVQSSSSPFFWQEPLRCSETALSPCKKQHLATLTHSQMTLQLKSWRQWIPIMHLWRVVSENKLDVDYFIVKWFILHLYVLHLEPNSTPVVTTGEARAGDIPTNIHKQHHTALIWQKASQTDFPQYLKSKDHLAATRQQRPESLAEILPLTRFLFISKNIRLRNSLKIVMIVNCSNIH